LTSRTVRKNLAPNTIEISVNQGLFAFFRGTNALIYKTVISNTLRFGLYESLFQGLEASKGQFAASVGAATATALVATAVTYPLDLAQGRMAADMTKKSTGVVASAAKPRLYSSVRDCLQQT